MKKQQSTNGSSTKVFDRSKFGIKNLQVHDTHDGYAYICSFYYGGSRLARVQHDGQGGDAMFDALDSAAKQTLADIESWLKSLPPITGEPIQGKTFELPWNLDLLIDELVVEERTRRDLKRLCRNKIVFAEARQGITPHNYLKNRDWYLYKNTRWNADNKRRVLEMEGSDIFILNDVFKPINLDEEPAAGRHGQTK